MEKEDVVADVLTKLFFCDSDVPDAKLFCVFGFFIDISCFDLIVSFQARIISIIATRKRWRNPGFSRSVKIFENISVTLKKIKGIFRHN